MSQKKSEKKVVEKVFQVVKLIKNEQHFLTISNARVEVSQDTGPDPSSQHADPAGCSPCKRARALSVELNSVDTNLSALVAELADDKVPAEDNLNGLLKLSVESTRQAFFCTIFQHDHM